LIYSEGGVYDWNLGVSQLPFVAFAVTGAITFVGYAYYQKYRIGKLYATGKFVPEDRLEIGLMASISIPIVTLIFGWTARKSVHWIVPVIFGALCESDLSLRALFRISAYTGITIQRPARCLLVLPVNLGVSSTLDKQRA
jgi:DHA1 family multidrug resistance protein-like MFS transporter